MADKEERLSKRNAKKCAEVTKILVRQEMRAHSKKITEILKKPIGEHTAADTALLASSPEVVKKVQKGARTRQLQKDRQLEVEDSPEGLQQKCIQLATAIKQADNVVLYTGAGISTAASIPDYRGPNGVWTLLAKGQTPVCQDLADAEPTFTHMCISALYRKGLIRHVVSQNCDGLHLRSGLPRHALSELHGNMFIEICPECRPLLEYIRMFDVTEKTGLRKHKTGRHCQTCGTELKDTIVHFGEKGALHSPHNWEEAADAADTADVIVCLGSSLKVLKKYPCLWGMHKPKDERPKLFIVNLQWTPKDDSAVLKINGRCDDVMNMVASQLGISVSPYLRELDPIFFMAKPLLDEEIKTTTKKILPIPPGYDKTKVQTIHNVPAAMVKGNKTKPHRKRKKLDLEQLQLQLESSTSGSPSSNSSPGVSILNPFGPDDVSEDSLFMEDCVEEMEMFGENYVALNEDKDIFDTDSGITTENAKKLTNSDSAPKVEIKEHNNTAPFQSLRKEGNNPIGFRESECKKEGSNITESCSPSKAVNNTSISMDTSDENAVQADDFAEMRLAYSAETELKTIKVEESSKISALDKTGGNNEDLNPTQGRNIEKSPSHALKHSNQALQNASKSPIDMRLISEKPVVSNNNELLVSDAQKELHTSLANSNQEVKVNMVESSKITPVTKEQGSEMTTSVSVSNADDANKVSKADQVINDANDKVAMQVQQGNNNVPNCKTDTQCDRNNYSEEVTTCKDNQEKNVQLFKDASQNCDNQISKTSSLETNVPSSETVENSNPNTKDDGLKVPESSRPGSNSPQTGRQDCEMLGHNSNCQCETVIQKPVDISHRNYTFDWDESAPRKYIVNEVRLTLGDVKKKLIEIEENEKVEAEKQAKLANENIPVSVVNTPVEEVIEEEVIEPAQNLMPLGQNIFPGLEILERNVEDSRPAGLVTATEEELNSFISESLRDVPSQDLISGNLDSSAPGRVLSQMDSLPQVMMTPQDSLQQSNQLVSADPETENACVVLMQQQVSNDSITEEEVRALLPVPDEAMEVVVDETLQQQVAQEAQYSEVAVDDGIIPEGSTYFEAEDGMHVIHPDGKEIIYTTMETEEGTVLAATEVTPSVGITADPNFLSPTTVDHMLTESIQEEVVTTEKLPDLSMGTNFMSQLTGEFSAELESVIMTHLQGAGTQDSSLSSKLSTIESMVPDKMLEESITAFRQGVVAGCTQQLESNSMHQHNVDTHKNIPEKKPAARKRRSSTKTSVRQPIPVVKNKRSNSVATSNDALAAAMNQSGIIPSSPAHIPSMSRSSTPLAVNTTNQTTACLPQQPALNIPTSSSHNSISPSVALQHVRLFITPEGKLDLDAFSAISSHGDALLAFQCLVAVPDHQKTNEMHQVISALQAYGLVPPLQKPTSKPAMNTDLNAYTDNQRLRTPIRLPNGELLPEAHLQSAPVTPQPSLGIPRPMMSPRAHAKLSPQQPYQPKQTTPQNSELSKNFPSILDALQGPTKIQQQNMKLVNNPVNPQQPSAMTGTNIAVNQQFAPTSVHSKFPSTSLPQPCTVMNPVPPSIPPMVATTPKVQPPPHTVNMKIPNIEVTTSAMVNFLDTVLKQAPPPSVMHSHGGIISQVPMTLPQTALTTMSQVTKQAGSVYPALSGTGTVAYRPPDPLPYVPPPSQMVGNSAQQVPSQQPPAMSTKTNKPLADQEAQRRRIQNILDTHAALTANEKPHTTVAPPMPFPIPSITTANPSSQTKVPKRRNSSNSNRSSKPSKQAEVSHGLVSHPGTLPYLPPPSYLPTTQSDPIKKGNIPPPPIPVPYQNKPEESKQTLPSLLSGISICAANPLPPVQHVRTSQPTHHPAQHSPHIPQPHPSVLNQNLGGRTSTIESTVQNMSPHQTILSSSSSSSHTTSKPPKPPVSVLTSASAIPMNAINASAVNNPQKTLQGFTLVNVPSSSTSSSTGQAVLQQPSPSGNQTTSVVSTETTSSSISLPTSSSIQLPPLPSINIPGMPPGYPYIPPAPMTPEEARKQAEYYQYLAQGAAALPGDIASKYAELYRQMSAQASLSANLAQLASHGSTSSTPTTTTTSSSGGRNRSRARRPRSQSARKTSVSTVTSNVVSSPVVSTINAAKEPLSSPMNNLHAVHSSSASQQMNSIQSTQIRIPQQINPPQQSPSAEPLNKKAKTTTYQEALEMPPQKFTVQHQVLSSTSGMYNKQSIKTTSPSLQSLPPLIPLANNQQEQPLDLHNKQSIIQTHPGPIPTFVTGQEDRNLAASSKMQIETHNILPAIIDDKVQRSDETSVLNAVQPLPNDFTAMRNEPAFRPTTDNIHPAALENASNVITIQPTSQTNETEPPLTRTADGETTGKVAINDTVNDAASSSSQSTELSVGNAPTPTNTNPATPIPPAAPVTPTVQHLTSVGEMSGGISPTVPNNGSITVGSENSNSSSVKSDNLCMSPVPNPGDMSIQERKQMYRQASFNNASPHPLAQIPSNTNEPGSTSGSPGSSPVTATPGWFGKGLRMKKPQRKRSK